MQRCICILPMICIAAILLLCGCRDNPANPPLDAGGAAEVGGSQASAPSHHCLGCFSLVFDTVEGSVTALPVRSADWHFNMTGVLNNTMGVVPTLVPGESDPSNGLIVIDITLTHPFGTRPQLTGFDVKGVLIAPGSLAVGPLIFADAHETCLENADGFTRWWNPTEFTSPGMLGYTHGNLATAMPTQLTATVNPYKLFADILGPEDSLSWVSGEPLDSPEGRAVFTAGNSNTRRYRIRFEMDPGPQIIYGYAVDCAWNLPSPNPPGEIPDDFPMNANQPEAYRVVLQPAVNTLYYDSESGIGGGVLRMQVNVHDWQGQATGNTSAQVSAVRLYAPGLMASGVDAVFVSQDALKARYTCDLTGLAVPTEAGETQIICRVESSDGANYRQTTAPAPNETVSAFQVVTVDVPDPACHGDANNDWGEAVQVNLGEGVAGQVCLPDDYRDYFWFEVPLGFALSGSIDLYCEAQPTTLGLYTWDQELLFEASVSGGVATIPMSAVELHPERYYIRVFTSNETQVAPYYLALDVGLTDVTPDNPVEVTPPNLYCQPDYVFVHDDYLILYGTLDGLWVYDVSDPANPAYVSDIMMSMNHKPAVHYPHMYYIESQGGGIQHVSYIDISDVTNPVIHHSVIEYTCGLKDLLVDSEHLFVLTDEETPNASVCEYASDPTSPTHVITSIFEKDAWWLFDPDGLNPHVIARRKGADSVIDSYDIADISSWELDGTYNFGNTVRDVAYQGAYFYVLARNTADEFSEISVMHHDYSDPILVRDGVQIWWPIWYTITVSGDYLYGTGSDGLGVMDISDKTNPEGVSVTPVIGTPVRCTTDGNDAYVVINYNGLEVYDISYPPAPDKVTELPVVNTAYSMVRAGDFLVLSDSMDTYQVLKTLDISDPPNTHLVDSLPLSGGFWWMSYDNGVIGAMQGTDNVVLVDATDPTSLSIADTIPFWNTVRGVLVDGSALYVSEADGELTVYDVTNPSAPVYQTTVTLGFEMRYPISNGGYMAGISASDDIMILSLLNPWNPAHVGTYTPSDSPVTLSAVGDYIYICCDNLLEIVDISTPSAPAYAGSVLTPGTYDYDYQANDGQFVYINSWPYAGTVPAIISIWPPDAPEVIYTFDPWPYSNGYAGIIEYEGYLYISSYKGIRIFDLY
jgi:hypothetical protein